jgi:hypothetical protein
MQANDIVMQQRRGLPAMRSGAGVQAGFSISVSFCAPE